MNLSKGQGVEMSKYSDRIREYEIRKTMLIMTCNDPETLEKELKRLVKELKI